MLLDEADVVLEADQRAAHEGVGGSAVSELEVRGLRLSAGSCEMEL